MTASPIRETVAKITAAEADHPAMSIHEWEVRKALLRVTTDIAEDDHLNQALGWWRIAELAMKRGNQFLEAYNKPKEGA